MSTATRENIVQWMIDVDDPLDLMRVNWHREDPFTQVGMWNVTDDTQILGIRLMMTDDQGHKGYLLHVYDNDEDASSFVVIATYTDKCQECGAQPHDSMWWQADSYDEDGNFLGVEIDAWATGVIHGMWDNAENGFEFNHAEGCANGALTMEPDEEAEMVDASDA